MNRCRWTAVVALAGLGLVSGCCNIGNGQLLSRLGLRRECPCETVVGEGGAPCCNGCNGGPLPGEPPPAVPIQGVPTANGGPPPYGLPMIPPGATTAPPLPQPTPEAPATPAGPTSKIK